MKSLKYILFLIVLTSIIGCSTNDNKVNGFGNSFNDESYIWESFQFPTNRVMDKK